ncbi:hypothetical protein E2C01_084880 [Portunus trituberculatus]|uniref:Uncharacterized protein n=1 Tax=Portunus trituberculatus TaxID=210409 RepID=A0A5B7J8Y3_PORTR|nr:hypothetical protein [Portunus trituberculatus]
MVCNTGDAGRRRREKGIAECKWNNKRGGRKLAIQRPECSYSVRDSGFARPSLTLPPTPPPSPLLPLRSLLTSQRTPVAVARQMPTTAAAAAVQRDSA